MASGHCHCSSLMKCVSRPFPWKHPQQVVPFVCESRVSAPSTGDPQGDRAPRPVGVHAAAGAVARAVACFVATGGRRTRAPSSGPRLQVQDLCIPLGCHF